MCGLLASESITVSEQRVGQSLSRASPLNHYIRCTSIKHRLNPVPYHADYFGHKLHIDQNEKIAMYGVTHVCACDGYSSKIIGFVSMPMKNNLEIYENLYWYVCYYNASIYHKLNSPIVKEYGMWDQLRIDHGKEWYLSLYVQEQLAHLRVNTRRAPHLQTSSKLVHK